MRTARRKHVKHMHDPDSTAVIPADAKRVCGKSPKGIVSAPEDKAENVRYQPSLKPEPGKAFAYKSWANVISFGKLGDGHCRKTGGE